MESKTNSSSRKQEEGKSAYGDMKNDPENLAGAKNEKVVNDLKKERREPEQN